MERDFPPALLVRARLEIRAGHLEEAEKSLRSLLLKANQDIRTRANYQLGAVLDRQGRYDEAMAAFVEAKAPFQPEAGPYFLQRQLVGAHLREMLTSLSPEMLSAGSMPDGSFNRPNAWPCFPVIPAQAPPCWSRCWIRIPTLFQSRRRKFSTEMSMCRWPAHSRRRNLVRVCRSTSKCPFEWNCPLLNAAPTDLLRQLRENYFHSMELALGQPIGNRLLVDKNPSLTLLMLGFQRAFPEIQTHDRPARSARRGIELFHA